MESVGRAKDEDREEVRDGVGGGQRTRMGKRYGMESGGRAKDEDGEEVRDGEWGEGKG